MQRTGTGIELAEKRRVSLCAQFSRESFRVLLVRETAELHGPHPGRGFHRNLGFAVGLAVGNLRRDCNFFLCFWLCLRRLNLDGLRLLFRGRGLARRHRLLPVAIEDNRLHHALLLALARQGHRFADDLVVARRPVEEYGYDQYSHADEYDRSDYALFKCSIHCLLQELQPSAALSITYRKH